MEMITETVRPSKKMLITGRVISVLCILFFLFDAMPKILAVEQVMKFCDQLELPRKVIPGIGIALLVSTVIYSIPRTAVLGAILLTGYLGGAILTHVRMGGPVFPIVFSFLFGVLVWLGIYLREPKLRALVPIRQT